MGDKIGKKDGPTSRAKRRGFSHSDHISAGFELLDFGPKSKDNSWSYIQIFHSVYIEDRKKVVWQWDHSGTIDVRRCYLSLLYWGGQGQGLEAINHVVPLNNNKEAWLSKSATYDLDILNESQGPPPFSLLTYHAEHHLYALHLLWLVVGGSWWATTEQPNKHVKVAAISWPLVPTVHTRRRLHRCNSSQNFYALLALWAWTAVQSAVIRNNTWSHEL